MATDQHVLREYLVAMGFRVDETAGRKFDGHLQRLDRRASALTRNLMGVAAAAVTMTTIFARQMEKLYYTSRYAETTMGNIQALDFGFRSVGLQGGKAAEAVKAMTQAIRSNPGLTGLLNSLGVAVKGRDKSDVLVDLVGALRQMPPFIAERYAALFGIDPETLFYLSQGYEKLKETRDLRKQMAAEMGVDVDALSESTKEYMDLWRELTERAGLFAMILGDAALPYVRELITETNTLMTKWGRIVKDMKSAAPGSPDDPWRKLREGITGVAEGERVTLSEDAKRRLGAPEKEMPPVRHDKGAWSASKATQIWQRWQMAREKAAAKRMGKQDPYAPRIAADEAAVDAATDFSVFRGKPGPEIETVEEDGTRWRTESRFDPAAYLKELEKRYALPPGILDRVWQRESQRGDPRWMRSPAGAMGHFGFMPKTAKEYGLKDPDDFKESADAAARKWADLMKRYNGDVRKAAAAYNWGDGNLARYGLGNAPRETRDYMDAVAGPSSAAPSLEQQTNIHIHGVSDPRQAAEIAVSKQRDVNASLVRNFSPKVR